MKLSIKWLKEILPKMPATASLCNKLTSIGLEVASIKKISSDTIIDLEITPNRADCLSVYGISRDLSAAYKTKKLMPKTDKTKIDISKNIIKSINKTISPHYTCLQIDQIDNKVKTPKIIKDRLKACGIKPVNLIVDILNYVMIEIGQPFHAFDKDQLNGKLNVRFSKKNETINGLNDKKYNLEKGIPVISDQKKIHAIAGVIGSKESSITHLSKNIIIECAYFSPSLIRTSSKTYRLQTDSSYRFERGVNPISHEESLRRVIYLLKKFTKFKKIYLSKFPNNKLKQFKGKIIKTDILQFERILGKKINFNNVVNIFKNLEFGVKVSRNKLIIKSPPHRFDIENEYDLIEEFARIIGYEEFPPKELPPVYDKKKINNKDYSLNKITTTLVSKGYHEIKSYSFLPKSYQENFTSKNSIVRISNPISEDKAELRTSLIPSLVRTYKYNANRQCGDLKIFEVGNIYEKINKKLTSEHNHVAGLIAGKKSTLSLKTDSSNYTFFDLKGDLVSILPNLEFEASSKHKFLGDQAAIHQNKKCVGYCGIIAERLIGAESIDEPAFAFEILLSALNFPRNTTYKEISPFPKVKRDLTVLIDDKISGKAIIDIIGKQSYKYLINIKINDVFHDDDNWGKNKKSISIEFQFQKKKSTLLDSEVNDVMDKIINLLQVKFNAQLRTI